MQLGRSSTLIESLQKRIKYSEKISRGLPVLLPEFEGNLEINEEFLSAI
jgi:hypothetical protein